MNTNFTREIAQEDEPVDDVHEDLSIQNSMNTNFTRDKAQQENHEEDPSENGKPKTKALDENSICNSEITNFNQDNSRKYLDVNSDSDDVEELLNWPDSQEDDESTGTNPNEKPQPPISMKQRFKKISIEIDARDRSSNTPNNQRTNHPEQNSKPRSTSNIESTDGAEG